MPEIKVMITLDVEYLPDSEDVLRELMFERYANPSSVIVINEDEHILVTSESIELITDKIEK